MDDLAMVKRIKLDKSPIGSLGLSSLFFLKTLMSGRVTLHDLCINAGLID